MNAIKTKGKRAIPTKTRSTKLPSNTAATPGE